MNKLIIVTGGTKGIGRAIIETFAAHHFDIVTCSRNQNDLDELKSNVEKKVNGCSVFTFRADMSLKSEVFSFSEFIIGLNRKIDVLINNAGFFVPGEIASESDGALENMMNANLYSAYYMTRGVIRKMMDNKSGHIFNMCSIASIKAYSNGGSYAITKFALLGFSKCLREELKNYNIRVTAVMPGATLTASWEGVDLPEERFIKPEDIAQLIYSTHQLSSQSVVEEILIRPQLGDL